MSFWPGVQSALENVLTKATRIPFVWDDEPRKMLNRPFGVLSLGQSLSLGRDHYGYTFKDSDVTLDLYGYRELTINVQVFSRCAIGEHSSRALIEKARLSLANPIYRDELRSAGLIFVENHPVSDLKFAYQNRHESRATFDVVFRLMLHDQHKYRGNEYFDRVGE